MQLDGSVAFPTQSSQVSQLLKHEGTCVHGLHQPKQSQPSGPSPIAAGQTSLTGCG